MHSVADIDTIFSIMKEVDMQVSVLAEALAGSRNPDRAVSMHKLQNWLSSAGLEELASAVASLATGVNRAEQQNPPGDDSHPWF